MRTTTELQLGGAQCRAPRLLRLGLAGITALFATVLAAPANANTLISLSSPQNFAVVGFGNTYINLSSVTITGSVGLDTAMTSCCADNKNVINNMGPSSISGSAYVKYADMYEGPGNLGGSVNVVDYANAVQPYVENALELSADAAALTPTATYGAIKSPTPITGNGGVNVIRVNGDITDSLTLSGGANDYFIVNIYGTVNFGGNSTLGGTTIDPSHILYNFLGTSGSVIASHVGNTFYGTLLAPAYAFTLDGSFNGAIIGGGTVNGKDLSITLQSNASVVANPFSPTGGEVPEPSQWALILSGFALFVIFRRALRKRKGPASPVGSSPGLWRMSGHSMFPPAST